jgi:hypothetical protein
MFEKYKKMGNLLKIDFEEILMDNSFLGTEGVVTYVEFVHKSGLGGNIPEISISRRF